MDASQIYVEIELTFLLRIEYFGKTALPLYVLYNYTRKTKPFLWFNLLMFVFLSFGEFLVNGLRIEEVSLTLSTA